MSHILSEVPGVVQKRAVVEDVSIFNTLLNASGGPALFRATFGQYNYSMLIENSIISLMSVAEVEEKCLGFLVVNDSPTVSMENDTFCAMVASVNTYLPDVIPSNTLFLNFFLVDETSRYDSDKVSFDLVRNAFAIYPQMDYIIWLCPSKVRLGFWMEDNFAEILLESEEESKAETVKGALPSGVRLLYLNRSKFMPKLLARTARVEDNDDLLPILYNSNPQIVSGQSDFFLADLIQSQDGRNKFLVGVHKNKPVGMLASSLDVNVTLITKIFDIDGYPDIIVAKEKKAPPPPLLISLVGDIRAAPKRSLHGTAADMNCLVVHAEEILSMQSSSEEKDSSRSEAEESKMARQAMDCLRAHLAGLVKEASDKAPTACVVVGFPRNDTEAHEMSLGYMKFDVILEVNDESGALDAEGDEEELADPFLRQDRDSIEALRSFTETQNNFTTPWFRVALGAENGSGSVEEDLASCLRNIVHQRAQEVQALLAMDEDEPPQANAFAVTVFCIEDEFQSRADDMLRVAFEDNPSLDYCLYMTSNAARPTLLTASMVIVKQRVGVTFDQSLFIIHRDALIARDVLHVERFAKTQMEAVEAFIAPLSGAGEKDRLKKLCNECLKQNDVELKDNPPEVCFLVMMGADVVGVVTAGRHHLGNDDVNWIRCNYQIDEVINFERHRLRSQAQITNFIMSPAYSKWSRFVIREIMRKYSKTLLYYQNAVEIAPPGEIIDEMIPVAPRRRMQASPDSPLPMAEKPSPSGATIDSPLFYLTKRQISECKTCVPKKVVIIGGGSASYAMLERLLFAPHLNFPNIHLVMELPPRAFKTEGADPSFSYSEKCSGVLSVEDADDPSMRELSAMGIAHRVSIVRGRLTDIDRANKAVVISDEIISEYDLLVIASSTKDCSTKRFPTTSGTHPSHCAFRGMFGLGDAASDAAALTWVKQQSRDRQKVIVYGCDLDAIATVGQLLQQGVDALRITVVISSSKIEEICHPFVVESLMRNLRGCGVYVRMGFEIIDVQLTKFGSIESVTLKSVVGEGEGMDGLAETMTLQCFSLLCSGAKYCDSDVFTAVNDCGIVFDGGMVVDKNFATIDQNIFAVGGFTRFSRVFREEPLHCKHSPRELGLFVANQILQMHLDVDSPQVTFGLARGKDTFRPPSYGAQALPKFRFPKTFSVAMPNSTIFFYSALSSAQSASDTALLLTGDLSTEQICVLKLDSLGMLLEMAYVGKSEVESRNLGTLVGWHESFLNGAVYSYEQGLVEDWIEYFRGDWATALYHDAFPVLADSIRSALQTDKSVFSTVDLMLDAGDRSIDDQEVLNERRQVLGPRAEKLLPATHKSIELATTDFLRKHKLMLMKFYIPPVKTQPKK